MSVEAFPARRLVVAGLGCRRGGRLIFSDLSFTLASGDAIALTGRNGAGKSSLIAMICGRLRPDTGTIGCDGEGSSEDDAPLRELIHHLGHREGLKSALTARENLDTAQALLGAPDLSVGAALERVGLPHVAELPVGYLSAGQKRRVALARLLVARRPFWLLDEPAAALDTASQQMLCGLMDEHRERGGAILAATHGPLGIAAREVRIGA